MTKLDIVRSTLEQNAAITVVGEKEVATYVEDPEKPERLSKVTFHISPSEPMAFAHLTALQMRMFDGVDCQPDENTYFSRLKPEVGVIRFSESETGADNRLHNQHITVKVYKDLPTAQHCARRDHGW